MSWKSWNLRSAPPPLTILSGIVTAIIALLVGYVLDARTQAIDAGFAIVCASLLIMARSAWRPREDYDQQRRLAETVELRDGEPPGPTDRVAALTVRLASQLGFGERERQPLSPRPARRADRPCRPRVQRCGCLRCADLRAPRPGSMERGMRPRLDQAQSREAL